jgi:hypothetical protein
MSHMSHMSLIATSLSVLAACLLLNICGASVVQLNETNFAAEYASKDWLIYLYDAECRGCKSTHMMFAELANSTSISKIGLGRIDGGMNKALAKTLGVDKYPTIMYKEAGEMVVYDGVKKKEVLEVFMERMQAPAWIDIKSLDDLYGKSDFAGGVTFVLIVYTEHSEQSEQSDADGAAVGAVGAVGVQGVFEAVAKRMKKSSAFALLAVGPEEARYGDGETQLVRMEPGRPPLSLSGAALLSPLDVEAFVAENNYPLCGELTQLSMKRLDSIDKLMVVAVFDPAQADQAAALQRAFTAAGTTYI